MNKGWVVGWVAGKFFAFGIDEPGAYDPLGVSGLTCCFNAQVRLTADRAKDFVDRMNAKAAAATKLRGYAGGFAVKLSMEQVEKALASKKIVWEKRHAGVDSDAPVL